MRFFLFARPDGVAAAAAAAEHATPKPSTTGPSATPASAASAPATPEPASASEPATELAASSESFAGETRRAIGGGGGSWCFGVIGTSFGS